jgi:hypothetical protein
VRKLCGVTVPAAPTAFSSDDGSADPRLVAALAAYQAGTGGSVDILEALAASRVLVPVVAVLDEQDESGTEKSSHMATVSTISRSGQRGLLAFTSTDAMKAWDPQARPVPVATRAAAEAALADKADAMVIDLAGPVTFAIEAPDLRSLASGWRSHAVDPAVAPVAAVRAARRGPRLVRLLRRLTSRQP